MRGIVPGDPAWSTIRSAFAARFDGVDEPRAILLPATTEDVVRAVAKARHGGGPIRIRGGGHSYEGYSSRAAGGTIIDLSLLHEIVMGDEQVSVGAGVRVGELATALGRHGLTIPLATAPEVGVGGLTLGGGFGVTSRRFGLTCDALIEAEIVDAEGRVLLANEGEHPDLFWALRGGGGGNFGVVTRLTFRTHPVGEVALFVVAFANRAVEEIAARWQEWAHDAPDAVGSLLTLRSDGYLAAIGQVTADDLAPVETLLAPLTEIAAGALVTRLPEPEATRTLWESELGGVRGSQLFKSGSAMAYRPLPEAALTILAEALRSLPPLRLPPSQPSMIQLIGGGGFVGRVPPDATAAHHRGARMLLQYDAYWTAPEDAVPAIAWADDLRRDLLPFTEGAYVNYHDAALADPLVDYFGPNLTRLREVKRRYDPEGVFVFPHGLAA